MWCHSLSPHLFTPPAPAVQVLKMLYDQDVVSEEAFAEWAAEKEHASTEEKTFLLKVSHLPLATPLFGVVYVFE